MAEVNKLAAYATIIGALAVIVLILMAVVLGFTKQVRTPTTENVDEITLAAVNQSVVLSSNPFIQSATGCVNSTSALGVNITNESNQLPAAQYTVVEGDANGGSLILNDDGAAWAGVDVNCSTVRYLADSDGQAAGDSFVTGLTIFATFIGVIILALIGLVIVNLYKKEKD